MSPLRRRMIEDMTVRNLSPYTQRHYLFAVSRLARHVRMSPAELGPEQLRDYLNHLVERKVSSSYFNVNVAALRFLYTVVLERDWVLPKLPLQKRSHKLPTVLSVEEVGRFLATVPDRKMRAVLVTAYVAGLRVFEVVALRVSDVDSTRMTLRVADGKGGKARLVMLSPKLLDLLRTYWKAERPRAEWLFPSRDPAQHVSVRSVQSACQVVYDILFRSTAATLRAIAADPRHLGAEIGLVAVLHTWGQTLQHHPHLHCIVPGGGLAPDGQRWVACRPGFFLPVRVLSSLFRRLFLETLDQAFRAGELVFRGSLADLNEPERFAEQLQAARGIDWVVYAKRPFGGPEQVLDYLGRYTHRVAIANSRLTQIGDSTVSFGWKDYRHNDRRKVMTLDAHAFIRRFLLHVLPDGFQRIRHYGLLGNRGRQAKLARCRELLDAPPPLPPVLAPLADPHDRYQALTGRSLHVCPAGSAGAMRRVEILPATVGRSTRPVWANTS